MLVPPASRWLCRPRTEALAPLAHPAAATEERKVAAPEKLVHSLDILEAFGTLQLEVPLTSDKCPPLLEAVAAKKEEFLQRCAVRQLPATDVAGGLGEPGG
jgi:hypothetical protein